MQPDPRARELPPSGSRRLGVALPSAPQPLFRRRRRRRRCRRVPAVRYCRGMPETRLLHVNTHAARLLGSYPAGGGVARLPFESAARSRAANFGAARSFLPVYERLLIYLRRTKARKRARSIRFPGGSGREKEGEREKMGERTGGNARAKERKYPIPHPGRDRNSCFVRDVGTRNAPARHHRHLSHLPLSTVRTRPGPPRSPSRRCAHQPRSFPSGLFKNTTRKGASIGSAA